MQAMRGLREGVPRAGGQDGIEYAATLRVAAERDTRGGVMAEVLEVNELNFEAEIVNSGKPALIDFWAPWCGPCRMMHPVIEGLAEEYAGKAVIGRCNVDENQALAQKFGVTAIPTLIVFKNGELSDSMIGVTSAEEIKKKLASD